MSTKILAGCLLNTVNYMNFFMKKASQVKSKANQVEVNGKKQNFLKELERFKIFFHDF